MLDSLKNLLIGSPVPTKQLAETRLNKVRALASFSPGALSSIAYANQEIYLALVVAGSVGLSQAGPISLAITALLLIVALSYYQTIHGYPSGGGSYVVARENLGTLSGLLAASALLVDYVLTAAVSLTAGLEAMASAAPALWPYRVLAALLILAVVTLVNLRGARETSSLMTIPVYLFLLCYFPMLALGAWRVISAGPVALAAAAPTALQPLTMLLLLRAFATGCTAMTGIEAVSNGVPVFRAPAAQNAGRTLLVMAVLMSALFAASIWITQSLAVVSGPQETILSALARRILGTGPAYWIIQVSTLLILAVAANTSFAGFPQLAALLARDGFLPRQLSGLGDRLVFANGILWLALITAALIIVSRGDSHALIPLFAVGAFLAYTLSQIGMVRHWARTQGRGWQLKAAINGLGAAATGVTLLVVLLEKFRDGAWLTVIAIPALTLGFGQIRRHYRAVASQLSLRGLPPSLKPFPAPRVVIPISGIHRGIVDALGFARTISQDVTAVYVELEPEQGMRIQQEWAAWWPDVPLVVVPSPYRSLVGPLLDYLDATDREHHDGQLAVVLLPEFVPAQRWHGILHNQTARLLKAALLYRRRRLGFQRVIIDVPYHLRR
ncbi:APC family permease [Candidatus Amarolinea aalborgensis]|uniref:APC family permease n=1 Tax=Candidatus Amarolinea aalborgensis TaxID=2249329 RepID=UPI003BF99CE3